MPDTRTHRGPHSDDLVLFAADQWPLLRAAAHDLSWLLERDYSMRSALELVGNRYRLTSRQRVAVERCTCAPSVARTRAARCVSEDALRGMPLWLDGYNVLLTLEVALGGGIVLHAADGAYRDLASVHGTYRTVAETRPAVHLFGRAYARLGCSEWVWYLDRPVSNSGKLKSLIETIASEHGWGWRVELVANPDPLLAQSPEVVASADSYILDRCARWYNLARSIIDQLPHQPRLVDLSSI
jgi:hypothetical protein